MKKHNKKGFTIVELVIVIGVIGILSAILIPTFVNVTKNAEIAARKSDLANAYSMYAADAADRIVDGTENAQTPTALEFLAQADVALQEEGKTGYYYFNNGAWTTSTVTEIAGKTISSAALGNKTYGGYNIYKLTASTSTNS